MKKKQYEKPTMQVVKLKQQAYLLQASSPGGTDPYTPDDNPYNW